MSAVAKQPIPKEGRLALGQRVKVQAHMTRVKDYPNAYWRRIPYRNSWGRELEPEGIIAGIRNLWEGHTESGDDYGLEFKPSKAFGVYLVAVDLRQILRVLPEDVTPLEPQQGGNGCEG